MKIYDIAQEVFNCEVYPGDPASEITVLSSIENGESYNLSAFSMCTHNGTHIDAPYHFLEDGKTVDEVSLDTFVGMAYVVEHQGIVSGEDAAKILKKANEQNPEAAKRILIKGNIEITLEAANTFATSEILLLGSESQTFGSEDTEMEVHLILLGADVVLLEGVRLTDVSEGIYLLNAAPLNLGGAEGSPCRAILMDTEVSPLSSKKMT